MDHSKVRAPECTAFPWHLLTNHNAIYSCHPFTKGKQTHLYIINSENEVKCLIKKKNAVCSNLKCLLLSNVNIQIFIIWSLNIFVRTFWFLSFDTRLENIVYSIFQSKVKYSVIGHPLLIVLPWRELPGGCYQGGGIALFILGCEFLLLGQRFLVVRLLPCPTLWDLMDCSMPGSSVLHCLLKFAQIHVHRVGDVIQPSHPLLPASPPALSLSQHQGLFQWFGSSHQKVKVLEL